MFGYGYVYYFQQAAAYPMQLAAAQQTAAMYAAIPQNYAAVQTSPVSI